MVWDKLSTVDTDVNGVLSRMTVANDGHYIVLFEAYTDWGLVCLRESADDGQTWGSRVVFWYGGYCNFDITRPAGPVTHPYRLIIVLYDYGDYGLWDDDKAWSSDQWAEDFIVITGGTGANQGGKLKGNSSTRVYFDKTYLADGWWSCAGYSGVRPDSTSEYKLWYSDYFGVLDSGTAESGGTNTLTDTDKMWMTDQWVGEIVLIYAGTGAGQARTISGNSGDTLTVSSNWDAQPDNTSEYVILDADAPDDSGTADRTDAIVALPSDDNGATWGNPVVVVSDPLDFCDLAVTISEENVLVLYGKYSGVGLIGRKSADQGETWADTATNPSDTGTLPILYNSDIAMVVVFRENNGYAYERLTEDGGDTWSTPTPLYFEFCPTGAHMGFDAEISAPNSTLYYARENFGPKIEGSIEGRAPDTVLVDPGSYPGLCPEGANNDMLLAVITSYYTLDLYKGFITAGWSGKISGVLNPAKVMSIPRANIEKVKGK